MMRTKDGYKLTSGREFYAYNGMLSIGPEQPNECAYGYDGDVVESWLVGPDDPLRDPVDEPFTPAERREIADFMIRLWQQFKSASLTVDQ